jgi:hypothetical protein
VSIGNLMSLVLETGQDVTRCFVRLMEGLGRICQRLGLIGRVKHWRLIIVIAAVAVRCIRIDAVLVGTVMAGRSFHGITVAVWREKASRSCFLVSQITPQTPEMRNE